MPTLIVSAAATLARAVWYGEIVVGMVAVVTQEQARSFTFTATFEYAHAKA